MKSNLGEVLARDIDSSIETYENALKLEKEHVFSDDFNDNMTQLISNDRVSRKNIKRRKRLLVAFIAAIVMSIASVTAIAICTPHIEYKTKEYDGHCEVTFDVPEGGIVESLAKNIPDVPEGYEIIDENSDDSIYYIDYTDGNHTIHFRQMIPAGTTVSVNETNHNGIFTTLYKRNAILFEESDKFTLIFEDGKYVYIVEGDCDLNTIYDLTKSLL